jgi:hypothetical protein
MTTIFKKIHLVVLGLAALLISSCGGHSSSLGDEVEYIPFKESEDSNWGFVDRNGKIKYPDEFKETPTNIVNGYFSVKDGDVYTLYKAADKPEAVKGCEELYAVGMMREGLIPVTKCGKRISVVDGNGKTRFTLEPIDGVEIAACAPCYREGLLMIQTDSAKIGYVDTKGNVVIKPKYTAAGVFNEGKVFVATGTGSEQKGFVINKKGEVLYKFRDDYTLLGLYYLGGVLPVKDGNDRIIFLNEKGEVKYKCPSKVDAVSDYNSKYFTYKNKDDEWGVMDYKGEIVVRAKYELVQLMDDDKFLCTQKGKSVIIDKSGEEKYVVEDFKGVYGVCGFFVGVDENSYSLLDKELKPVKNAEFDVIEYSEPNSLIESNYINVDEIINTITGLINSKGVGKYALGSKPSEHFSNPEDYSGYGDVPTISLPDMEKSGFKYHITCEASYNEYLSYLDTEKNVIRWNPDAILYRVTIFVSGSYKLDSSQISKLTKAIQAKGYKMSEGDPMESNVGIFENGKVKISVNYNDEYSNMSISVDLPYEVESNVFVD